MCREKTIEECRQEFLEQISADCRYWANVRLEPEHDTVSYRMSGLVFSFLVILDGGSALPAFDVIPSPHEEDEEFLRGEGENWWPRIPDDLREGLPVINECQLHEMWHKLHGE